MKKMNFSGYFVLISIILILNISCQNEIDIQTKNVINYFIDSVLNESNYKDKINIFYKFEKEHEIEYLQQDYLKTKYDFNTNSFNNQIIKFKNKKISLFLNENNKIKVSNNLDLIKEDEILVVLTPPLFSENKEYILFFIKYTFYYEGIKYWSYRGIIIENKNGIFKVCTDFIDHKELNSIFNDAEYIGSVGNLIFNYPNKK